MFVIELIDIIFKLDGQFVIGAKESGFSLFLTPLMWFFVWSVGVRVQSWYWKTEISNIGQLNTVSTPMLLWWVTIFLSWFAFVLIILIPIFHVIVLPVLYRMAYAIST